MAKLQKKFDIGTGFCLSGNIVSEVLYGKHCPEEFERIIGEGNFEVHQVRRYAEVLLGKGILDKGGLGETQLIELMVGRIRGNSINPQRLEDIYSEFSDWNLRREVNGNGR